MALRWRQRLDERGLRVLFAAFFLALAVPAAVLVVQANRQLESEAFRSSQLAAEELAARIDAALRSATAVEEARSFADYSFLIVEGDAAANFVQRSPLSAFPVVGAWPGVLGYFQVDAEGRLTTPTLPTTGVAPASYGIPPEELASREALVAQLADVLAQNRLVRASREEEPPPAPAARRASAGASTTVSTEAQAAFDELALSSRAAIREAPRAFSSAAERTANAPAADLAAPQAAVADDADGVARQKRVEQGLVAEAVTAPAPDSSPSGELRIRTFESEVDPFELGVLDTGHLVLFRNVWRDGARYVQGALLDRREFVSRAIEAPWRVSGVAGVGGVEVVIRGRAVEVLSGRDASQRAGATLYRARLSPPFSDVELVFGLAVLPPAPGASLIAWVTVVLAVVLCGGFALMYRFAAGQMRLARQQQDFVSAVSHELKTPLTSIRMYGEMLRAGWADEAKRRTYYDYIHSESERLSRLIDNVLELARLTRSAPRAALEPATVDDVLSFVRDKVATQVERAGFELRIVSDAAQESEILVDRDCIAQIFINLVDNALKFAAGGAIKTVEIGSRRESGGIVLTVRDFGPGVPKPQMKKIFRIFYRAETELTRETVGTGIGLALVRQLAEAMHATVDVRNRDPGAEFQVRFPA